MVLIIDFCPKSNLAKEWIVIMISSLISFLRINSEILLFSIYTYITNKYMYMTKRRVFLYRDGNLYINEGWLGISQSPFDIITF